MSALFTTAALLGSAVLGCVSALITGRWEKRTEAAKTFIDEGALELDGRRVDGEAFERAQRINQAIIETLQVQLTRLETTIESLERELTEERKRSARLERNLRQLQDTAATMRRLLTDAGIDFPPPAVEGGGH